MSEIKPCKCGNMPVKFDLRFDNERSISYACMNPDCMKASQEEAEKIRENAAIEIWNNLAEGKNA